MKPILLTITAFGPYKDKEVIDFRKLQNHQLFVISGNTGAGKTTIFDAICYALYGEASGEERKDPKMLRSHFADDDVFTTVELVFQLRNKTYKVYRKLGHIKKGNKTPSVSVAELSEIEDGKEIPCCEAKIFEVNRKIEELIGLTKAQFSQIVMLPQGEFRKLLTSDTDNKEEILRRIFKTETYQSLKNRFDEKRKKAENEVNEVNAQLRIVYGNLKSLIPKRETSILHDILSEEQVNHHQVRQVLQEEYEEYEKKQEKVKEQLIQIEKLYKEKEVQFHEAKRLEEKFQEYEKSCQKKQELILKSEEMNNQRFLLQRGEKAKSLLPFEEQLNDITKRCEEKEADVLKTKKKLESICEQQIQVTKLYEEEKEKEPIRKEKEKLLQQLHDWKPVVHSLAIQEKEVDSFRLMVQQYEQKFKKINEKMDQFEKDKKLLTADIKGSEEKVVPLANLKVELERLTQDGKKLNRLVAITKEVEQKQSEIKQVSKQLQQVEKKYEEIEQLWIEGQASLLALHLHDGEACPVCGSVSHPEKAIQKDKVPSKEQLERVRIEKQKVEKEYQQLENDDFILKNNQQMLRDDLQERNYQSNNPEQELKEHRTRFKQKRQEIRELELLQLQLDTKKHQLDSIEKRLDELSGEKEEIQLKLMEVKGEYENRAGSFTSNREKVPTKYRSELILLSQIKRFEKQLAELEKNWRDIQTEKSAVDEQLISFKTQVKEKEATLQELYNTKKLATRRLQNELKQAAFSSLEDYRRAKIPSEKMTLMKQTIELYDTETKHLNQQIKELEKQINQRERPDLTQLRLQLSSFEQEKIQMFERVHQIETMVEQIKHLQTQCQTLLKLGEEKERAHRILLDLYDVIRGNNQKKISFERYLQIEFLEKIIYVANKRLYHLSNGQFSLKRSERIEKNGKQSGLGLDVYDEYTGQTRDVKTLSGGEKFNASLCLALGMADVIQAYQGGISIETMFIDEGFGSLDEESLQKAIETLIDLQKSGRMIGIISHVQELKYAIPAILEVKKTKEGYSYTNFVIK